MPANRTYNPCYTVSKYSSDEPIMAVRSIGKIDANALSDQPYLTEGDLVYIDTSTGRFEQASAEAGKLPQFILISMPGNINASDITMGNPAYGHKFVAVRRARITKSDRSTAWIPGTKLVVSATTSDYSATTGNIFTKGSSNSSNYVVGYAISAYEAIIDLANAHWLLNSGTATASGSGNVSVTFPEAFSVAPTGVAVTPATSGLTCYIVSVSATGLTINFSGAGTAYWIATK